MSLLWRQTPLLYNISYIALLVLMLCLVLSYIIIGVMSYLPEKSYQSTPYTKEEQLELSSLRIAIHISGEVRGSRSIESIYKYIINPLKAALRFFIIC